MGQRPAADRRPPPDGSAAHARHLSSRPLFTACLPHSHGVLDDHFESWFLTSPDAIDVGRGFGGDDMDSVNGLPRTTDWLDPPSAGGRLDRVSS